MRIEMIFCRIGFPAWGYTNIRVIFGFGGDSGLSVHHRRVIARNEAISSASYILLFD